MSNALRRGSVLRAVAGIAALLAALPGVAIAAKNGPGVSDTEIRIGQTMPYSGPASAYGAIGRAEAAYFRKLNDEGGIGGRKINLISLDDGYSPPKTVEQVRRLVEQDDVLATFNMLGTAPNSAVIKYLNGRKVPHLLLATGANKFNDPANFPYTTPGQPSYEAEARIYAKYILKNLPNAKIAVLYQNDDYGKDYLKGLNDALGDKAAKMVVAQAAYETSDPTIDSQVLALKASGADVLIDVTTPKFAAQAIRKVAEIGWKPLHFLNNVSISTSGVLQPAGIENAVGLVTGSYLRDPIDPEWQGDAGLQAYFAWAKKYAPDEDPNSYFVSYGYLEAMTLERILRQCGDDLSRENVLKQATRLDKLALPLLLPGITMSTSPTNYAGIRQLQLARFDGKRWVRFGELLSAD